MPTYIPFQKFGETLIDLPLNVDRSNLTKYLVFPGLHAPHMLLDHDRRRDAALILVSKRPRPVPTLDQHHLIQFEQRKMQWQEQEKNTMRLNNRDDLVRFQTIYINDWFFFLNSITTFCRQYTTEY